MWFLPTVIVSALLLNLLMHLTGLESILLYVTSSSLKVASPTHLASSRSSVLWIASCSYFILSCTISVLPLDRARCSSALASCSSSYCSRRRSKSCLADCRAWARTLWDWMTYKFKKTSPLTLKHLDVTFFFQIKLIKFC